MTFTHFKAQFNKFLESYKTERKIQVLALCKILLITVFAT